MNPFDHLRQELSREADSKPGRDVHPDTERLRRSGVPEVVLAAWKTTEQIDTAIRSLLATGGRVIVSRLSPHAIDEIRVRFDSSADVSHTTGARAMLISLPGSAPPRTGGRVAVISAGTSDISVASEAVLMAEEMGCEVCSAWDVGVAGIHRLVSPLETLTMWDADVFVVAAGMDGVLPTVVAGLVRQPVIGLPVSTGYGFGGEGVGALTTMLQSCAPGLAVVNIDNGIGAGAMAALIANRAARFRQGPPETAP